MEMKRLFRIAAETIEAVPGSVVQEWLSRLSMMQQTVVLEMLRGCDGVSKEDPTKFIIRFFRSCVITNHGSGNFMVVEKKTLLSSVKSFFEDCDKYPLHFVMHLAHSAEIVGYKCPDKEIAEFWKNFYLDLCHTIHVNPESEREMDNRLRDNRDESEHGKKYRLVEDWKNMKAEAKKKAADKKKEEERKKDAEIDKKIAESPGRWAS